MEPKVCCRLRRRAPGNGGVAQGFRVNAALGGRLCLESDLQLTAHGPASGSRGGHCLPRSRARPFGAAKRLCRWRVRAVSAINCTFFAESPKSARFRSIGTQLSHRHAAINGPTVHWRAIRWAGLPRELLASAKLNPSGHLPDNWCNGQAALEMPRASHCAALTQGRGHRQRERTDVRGPDPVASLGSALRQGRPPRAQGPS